MILFCLAVSFGYLGLVTVMLVAKASLYQPLLDSHMVSLLWHTKCRVNLHTYFVTMNFTVQIYLKLCFDTFVTELDGNGLPTIRPHIYIWISFARIFTPNSLRFYHFVISECLDWSHWYNQNTYFIYILSYFNTIYLKTQYFRFVHLFGVFEIYPSYKTSLKMAETHSRFKTFLL